MSANGTFVVLFTRDLLDTPDYPDPIVDYAGARERFLAARA